MKIAKPLILLTTPIGVIGGVIEGYRLAGGLVFLMIALLMMIGAAIGMLVLTIRREEAEAQLRKSQAATSQAAPATRPFPAETLAS
jgi:uncharacterized protein (DUF58 family)